MSSQEPKSVLVAAVFSTHIDPLTEPQLLQNMTPTSSTSGSKHQLCQPCYDVMMSRHQSMYPTILANIQRGHAAGLASLALDRKSPAK